MLITLRSVRADTQLLHLLRELPDYLRKPRPFGRRNPLEAKALFLDTEIREHQLDGFRTFFGFEIALLIVTISRMAAADKDTVRPLGEGINHQVGMHHSRAHDADDADAGRVLGAGDAGQVCAGIGAPVATQRDDQGLKVVVHYSTPKAAWIWASI